VSCSAHLIIALDAHCYCRLADQKFGPFAEKFLKQAKEQMGVHIFMMIGYKNDKGQMLRSKFVVFHIIPVLLFTSCITRLETPHSHPTSPQFLPIFNRTGGDVWQSWDKFLDESDGISFPSTVAPYTE
jgi:hypothetical protein